MTWAEWVETCMTPEQEDRIVEVVAEFMEMLDREAAGAGDGAC